MDPSDSRIFLLQMRMSESTHLSPRLLDILEMVTRGGYWHSGDLALRAQDRFI